MNQQRDPFAVLGLNPTNDRAAVKRAYFRALQIHPPHSDPEAFRRIRAAYEALEAGGLLPALLRAPIEVEQERAKIREQLADAQRAAVARRGEGKGAEVARDAVLRLLRLDCESAIARVNAGG